jgi:hypothetical protein
MTVTGEDEPSLTRMQKRLLRRIYNGLFIPIITDGKPFLTYKDGTTHSPPIGMPTQLSVTLSPKRAFRPFSITDNSVQQS